MFYTMTVVTLLVSLYLGYKATLSMDKHLEEKGE